MRSIKGSLVGLALAGILALAPTAAFAHGGGGGGHGGGGHIGGGGHSGGGGGHFGGGGGHFGGGGGHFAGGGGHFGGGSHFGGGGMGGAHATFGGGRAFGGRGFAFAGRRFDDGFHHHDFRHDHDLRRDHDRFFFGSGFGFYDPSWYWDYPYYGYDYPYYGYNASDYSQTIVAVQKELTQLGYYHGQVDGLIGPQTERAIRWFQSVDKLPVTGQIDDPTLKALRIS